MRRKIPKLLLGSVVVGLFVTGCTCDVGQTQDEYGNCKPSPPSPATKTNDESNSSGQESTAKSATQKTSETPIKQIQELEEQNKALKSELDGLNTQLDALIQLEKKNPQNKKLKGQIDSLSKDKIALEEQVEERTKQLCELRKMLGDNTTCPSP